MKRAALLGFSVLLVLAALVVVLPTFVDWNRYSDSIAGVLEDATGRDISVGTLSFHLLPQPTLRAADVVIANVEGGRTPELARLQALDIRLDVLPLITGTLRIRSIGLVAPSIHLEELPGGGNNWTFGNADEQGGDSGSVRIDKLSVEGGSVDYTTADGTRHTFTDVEADLTAQSLTGPIDGTVKARYEDVPLQLDIETGDFANPSRAAPLSLTLKVLEADAELHLDGSMVREKASFSGTVQMKGPSLASLKREMSRVKGAPTIPALPESPYSLSGSLAGGPESLSVSDLTLSADGEEITGTAAATFADVPKIEMHLTASRFNLDKLLARLPDEPPVQAAQAGGFSLPKGLVLTADFSAAAVDYRGGIMRQLHLAAHLENGSLMLSPAQALLPGAADVSVSGRLSASGGEPAFVGQVSASAGNLRAMLDWAGMDVSRVPAGQLGQLTLSTPLVLNGDRLRLAGLDVNLDRSHLTGHLAATLGETPDIRGELVLDRLDIDAYMPEPEGESAAFSLKALTGFTGDVIATVERLSYEDRVASDVAAHAVLDGKTLTMDHLQAGQIGGASLSGTATVSALETVPQADLTFSAKGESASRFLSAIGYEAAQAALGPFALDVSYKGSMEKGQARATGNIGRTGLTVDASLRNLGKQPAAAASFDLQNPSLSDLARQLGRPLAAPEEGAVRVRLTGKLDGSAVQGTLELTTTLDGGDISVTGNYAKAEPGMTYRLDVKGTQDNPVPLMLAFGLPYEPAGPIRTASLAATVTGQPGVTRLENLQMTLGKLQMNGQAALDSTGKRPRFTAQLQGGDVDINAFLPPPDTGIAQAKAVQSQSAAAKAHVRWSREPLDWSLIRDNDADIRLTAKSLTFGPYSFTGPSLTVTAANGVLKVNPLAAGLFDGAATIRLTADATQTPQLDIVTELKDVDVARLSAASMGNRFATGKLGMSGHFTASGESQFDIIQSLDGSARLTARDGVIEKVDLPALSERLNAIRNVNDFLNTARSALSGGQTPYKQVSGDVTVQDGVARVSNVASDIEAGRVDLKATADLPKWTVDAQASFSLTEVPKAPPVTVTFTGPIDSPKRELGLSQLQTYVVGQLGAAVLRNAIGKQEGGLDELLGTTTPQRGGTGESQAQDQLGPFQMLFDQLRKKKE